MTDTPNNSPAKKAWGRQLEDFWLDGEEGKLHPAEEDLLRCAATGDFCVCGDKRPTSPNDQNRIRADFLRFVALGGDDQNPLHDHGVQIDCAYIEGSLQFKGAILSKNFGLLDCTIDGDLILLDCCAESFGLTGCSVNAIGGGRFRCTGDLLLRNQFRARQSVSLVGAKIGGALDCSGGSFEGIEESLTCDGVETKGSVFLGYAFQSTGNVRLLGAKIGGNFECRDGRFLAAGESLNIEGASINGAVFIDHGFLAKGKVDLTNAQIGTNLRCTGGTFSAKDVAINAPNIKVGNSVYLNTECRVRGEISFQSAEIGDSITFQGGSFETKGTINLRNAKAGNMLTWRGVEYIRGELNLAGASCKSLNMDHGAWEKPSQIRLDNFSYERFAELPKDCDTFFWKQWLKRQPRNHLNEKFRPNPYQHLARVLETMGHEEEAREIRIERRERQRLFTLNHVPLPQDPFRAGVRRLADFWRWVEKKIIGHGYRPGFAVIWLLGMIAVGAGIYEYAAAKGIMAPTHPLIFKEAIWKGDVESTAIKDIPKGKIPAACRKNWVYPKGERLSAACAATIPSEYSTFSSIVYSLDTAIPVVNFRMEEDWSPRVVHWTTGDPDFAGWMVRLWEWVQIGLGWAFSLLFVSAIGGVIRRD